MSQALQAVALGSSLGHGSEMSETHPTAAPGTVRGQWKKKNWATWAVYNSDSNGDISWSRCHPDVNHPLLPQQSRNHQAQRGHHLHCPSSSTSGGDWGPGRAGGLRRRRGRDGMRGS